MLEDICFRDASELSMLIRLKEISPVEVVRAHLQRIDSVNPKINAIVTMIPGAVEKAREAEACVMRGDNLGPLHGVPFTIKD
jgi:aspartyl-tRNA(Asn)/glutamyl-tRNA(Gln) amidotransferase subunit A